VKNFVVYKSSAGSGKTFTLVKEYLRLALADEKKLTTNYKYILAVTFTNKAAAEMKERVISALSQIIATKEISLIAKILCDELAINEAELKKRAQIVLSNILHHYSDFSVGTIDSFTHKLVKTFAYDLKLPINFNVELNVDSFYENVINSLINKIGEDEYVSKLLKEYALAKAEDNAGWDPEKHIKEFARLLQKEDSENYLQQLKQFDVVQFEEIRKELIAFIGYYKSNLKSLSKKTLDLIEKNNLKEEDFYYGKNGAINFFYKCFSLNVTIEETTGSRLQKAIKENKWSSKGINANLVDNLSNQLSQNAKELILFLETNFETYSLCVLISKQIYPILLLKKIEEIASEKKQEEQLVFISEFNKNIFDLINNEPTPFIYERLGDRYHHFLLDEFQDTSSLQFQNLLPLLDNSLANGWFNLIVGDGKQSIYRWRNANVNQFSILPQLENKTGSLIIEERAETLTRNFKENVLNTNYRSVKTIIDFNNHLFDSLSEKLLHDSTKPIYSQQAQIIKNPEIGYITINTGKTEKDNLDDLNFELVSKYILQAIQNNFDYNDICLIVRNNKDGNKIANYLVENKIPVVSSDSLLLQSNMEVNTLVAFLRYLANTNDKVSAAVVLNYACKINLINQSQFISALDKLNANDSLFEILNHLNISIYPQDYNLSNLLDNCIYFITALNLNKNGNTYLRFFLDEVNEYLVTKNSNLTSFIDWWETRSKTASMIIPASINAVKIMTIHASKGLEFPVVIIPYCNWQQYKANDSWVNIQNSQTKLPVAVVNLSSGIKNAGLELEFETETQEQILDNLNLLYVAFTRAVNRLHIITLSSSSNKQALISNWLEDYFKQNFTANKENEFTFGDENSKHTKHKAINTSTYKLEPLAFNTNNDVIKIKASYLDNSVEAEEAKQQGIVMHTILSKIKSENDIDEVLNSEILNGLIGEKQFDNFKQKILSVIHHPKLELYYKTTTPQKLEAELITSNGELLRPDKLVFLKNETIIIDYKTGKENNKKYFTQLLKYQNALQSMGYQDIKMLLVYIDSLNVVEVN
jgi:ATP-dependent exoDNAse (exonuclease V) beta subunit